MNDDEFIVEDNGAGMSPEQLAKAMKLGYSTKGQTKGKLGAFGLGMKTACTSLAKSFEIFTTPVGSDVTNRIVYDEEEWMKKGKWSEFEIETHDGAWTTAHGTKIVLHHPRVFYPNLVTNAKPEFGQRYYPYLENGEVEILVNNKACVADVPDTEWREDVNLTLSNGKTVTGWIGAMKKGKTVDHGLNLYKNGRLIKTFAAVGFRKHPEIGQLIGELYLDEFDVTHNKREFITADPAWEVLEKEFGTWIQPQLARLRAEETGADEGNRRVKKNITKKLTTLPAIATNSDALKKLAEQDPAELFGEADTVSVRFQKLGASEPAKKVTETDGQLEIVTNSEHTFFKESSDKEWIAIFYAAEAMAEKLVPSMDHRKIVAIRDLLLQAFYDKRLQKADDPEKMKERIQALEQQATEKLGDELQELLK